MAWPLWKTVWHFLLFLLLGIYPREIKICPHKYLCMNVCRRVIYNIQKVEATPMPIGWWMDTQNVVYANSGIIFGARNV